MTYSATNLQPHPEGGRFREVFRSPNTVRTSGGKSKSALTHIYFELDEGEKSRFHRVEQEEVWNLYRGKGLRLWVIDPETKRVSSHELSQAANQFCFVIPAGHWQAAEPLDGKVLIGCSVAPGFEFEDFELLSDDHALVPFIQNKNLERFL